MITAQVTMTPKEESARATPSASKDLPDVQVLCERLLRQQPQAKALLERLLARSRRTKRQCIFAAVQGNRCSACNMTVASAQVQKVKAGVFINCAHCSIFLFHLGNERNQRKIILTMIERDAFGLTIRDSPIHGKGCFAAISFHQDEQIAEYVGERISMAEAERRRSAFGGDCIFDVDSESAVDGSRGGNATRYINHSCRPNSYVVVSEGRIFLYALREVAAGEEITNDYLDEPHLESVICRCPAHRCDEKENTTIAPLTPGT